MLSGIMVMTGILLIGLVAAFKWRQRKAAHLAYWHRQREVEERKGEAAEQWPDSPQRRQKMDAAKADVERIDSELSRLTGSKKGVAHYIS